MLIDLDNFDFYNTPSQRWTVANNVTIVAGQGRNGTAAVRLFGPWAGLKRSYSNQQTYIVHFAFRFMLAPANITSIVQFWDGATVQNCLCLAHVSQKLQLRRGDWTGPLLATGITTLMQNAWYHIQLKVKIDNAVGLMSVRLNGVNEATFAGDTQQSANAHANIVHLYEETSIEAYFDDYMVFDGTGIINNDFGGDQRVYHKLPNGVGTYSDWTPLAGANWQNVDEKPPDEDVSYNASIVVGQKDSFTFAPSGLVVGSPGVAGIVCLYRNRKDDAGAHTMRRLISAGGVDHYGAALPGISDSYVYQQEVLELNPATAAPWTPAETDAVEYGYDLVS